MWDLIISVPDHYLSFYFEKESKKISNDQELCIGAQVTERCVAV